MRVWPGSPHPLGATWDGSGVNFAVFSEHATNVELCLFPSADAPMEQVCVPLAWRTDRVWHAYLPDARPGHVSTGIASSVPGIRRVGYRFNPSKVLLDPYARIIGRPLTWNRSLFAYADGTERRRGGGAQRQRAVRAARRDRRAAFTWGGDRPPRTPWHQTVIYELHVKGITARHPGVPAELARHVSRPVLRADRSSISSNLGVTAVELMPIHSSRRRVARS